MDHPQVDRHAAPPAPDVLVAQALAASGPPLVDRIREEQLRRLLSRLERGELEPYEYARRVGALEAATSEAAMAGIVDQPPPLEPTLDAVDLALLARSQPGAPKSHRSRYVWLAVVAVFFVAMLGIGMWLVSHARALQQTGNLGMAPVVTVADSPSL